MEKERYEPKMKGFLVVFGGDKNSCDYINYDYSRLLQTIVFFISRELKDVDKEDILPLYIDFETCVKNEEMQGGMKGCNGKLVVDEYDCFIHISCMNIKEQVQDNLMYKDHLKSLFYVILHELYHYFDLVNSFKNDISGYNTEEFNRSVQKIRYRKLNNLEENTYEYISTWGEIESEIAADEFAFRNLSYFENLYNYNSSLPGI